MKKHSFCSKLTGIYLFLLLLLSCGKKVELSSSSPNISLQEFEKQADSLSSFLIKNHTYDEANLPVADSLYALSEDLDSEIGKMAALRLRYYAYVADTDSGEKFLRAVDEYLDYAKQLTDKSNFYDAMNAKLYYYIGIQKFMAAQLMVKDVMKEAEKSMDKEGLYFSNYMMGNIYQNRDSYSMAIDYLLKAEEYTGGDSIRMTLINRELSLAYANLNDTENALTRAEKSRNYANTRVNKIWSEHQYLTALYDIKKEKEFAELYEKSDIREAGSDILPEYMLHELSFRYNVYKGNVTEAIRIANKIDYEYVRNNCLYDIYVRSKDFENAIRIKDKMDSIYTSFESEARMADLSEMEAQLGNSQLKLEAEDLKMNNLRIIFISVILILVVILTATIIFFMRHRSYLNTLSEKNKALDHALETAERASAAKTIFIKNMGHEINTPLNHISGFAQILACEDFPLDEDSTREMSRAIVESSDHLKHLLDNVVEVTNKLSQIDTLEEVESVLKKNTK